jgi:hypothetical protein
VNNSKDILGGIMFLIYLAGPISDAKEGMKTLAKIRIIDIDFFGS